MSSLLFFCGGSVRFDIIWFSLCSLARDHVENAAEAQNVSKGTVSQSVSKNMAAVLFVLRLVNYETETLQQFHTAHSSVSRWGPAMRSTLLVWCTKWKQLFLNAVKFSLNLGRLNLCIERRECIVSGSVRSDRQRVTSGEGHGHSSPHWARFASMYC